MHEVFLPFAAIDKYIVKEDQRELLKLWSKSYIHSVLEGARGSGEAEGHNPKLKLPEVGLEGGFEFLAGFHADLVKAGL